MGKGEGYEETTFRCNNGADHDVKVKDVIKNQDPDLYDRLSRGDKCRVGKAVSNRYEKHMYSGIVRGNDKGATKTYRKS